MCKVERFVLTILKEDYYYHIPVKVRVISQVRVAVQFGSLSPLRRSSVGKKEKCMKCGIGVSDKDDGIQCEACVTSTTQNVLA